MGHLTCAFGKGPIVSFAENLAKVFSLMDPNSPERVAFVSRALKWSSGGSGKLGHPRLHQLLALTLWKGRHGVPTFSQQPNPLCTCLLISWERTWGKHISLSLNQIVQDFCFGSKLTLDGPSTAYKGPLGSGAASFPISVLIL